MPLAFVAAVGGVRLEDVAVATFQLFQHGRLVDYAGPAVVGECAEKNGVFAVLGVEGAELGEVFAEQSVGLCLGELTASAVGLARLDLMTISDIGPVSWLMECFKLHQLKHRPFYGYGHRIQPGEHFPQHRPLTESEADALLRKDLKKFCAMYSEYGKDSVLLGALAYDIGPGAVNKSSVIKKLKSGDRNIFKAYTSHCHYKGKRHRGLYNRRLTKLVALFVP